MNIIRNYYTANYNSIRVLLLTCLLCTLLLLCRMLITKTNHYLFLIWNLFLAAIPYIITCYLSIKKRLHRFLFFILFLVWLSFLPNAPYIITDLFHLKISRYNYIWLNTLLIASFAISGLFLFYFSVIKMKRLLFRFFNKLLIKTIITTIFFLSAFGVYLGRYLRFNSWELLSNPKPIITDIITIITEPKNHSNAWFFTVIYGVFLYIGYCIASKFKPA